MQRQLIRRITFFLAAFLVISFCLVDADGQTRKKRRPRRVVKAPVITNPAIYQPGTATNADAAPLTEDKIISTADENPAAADQEAQKSAPKPASEEAAMQQTINKLSNQVERLSDQLTKKEELDRDRLDMERLTRAEQRAEQLRAQLIDVEGKLADMHARVEQIDYNLKPENIDRATQGAGTTRPEEIRNTRQRQLEGEKARLQAQIKLLETSRARLEPAIAMADSEVDLLRARLQQKRDQEAAEPPKPEPRPASTPKKP